MSESLRLRGLCFIALLIGLVLAMDGRALQAQDPGLRWGKGAPFPEPEEELYGVALYNKMYVIGGFGGARVVEIFDGQRWRRGPDLPLGVDHPMAAALGGS